MSRTPPEQRAGEPQVGVARDTELFSHRAAVVLRVLVPATLAVTLLHSLIAPGGSSGVEHGANTFSVSAVGYRGLVELLQATGVPVLASQHSSGQRASAEIPLVLLEPPAGSSEEVRDLINQARRRQARVVVVLPKWYYRADQKRPAWVSWVSPAPPSDPASVLELCLEDVDLTSDAIVRLPGSGSVQWLESLPWYRLLDLFESPSLPSPQLINRRVDGIEPLLWSDDGVLVGRVRDSHVLVIADPDLLNNAGLTRGDNAIVAHHLLVEVTEAKALVLDETLHGFTRTASLWRELLEPRLLPVPLHLALLLTAVLWTASDRFGRPAAAAPRFAAGISALVDSTARLIALGGTPAATLLEYWKLTVRRTAHDLGTGAAASLEQHVRLLADLGRRRGVSRELERLTVQVERLCASRGEPRRALALARSLHFWRREMLQGTEAAKGAADGE